MAPSVMLKYFSEAEVGSLQSMYSSGEVESTILQVKEKAKYLPSVPIHIALLGDAGSGKSTFINAMRGLHSDDPRAAPTGNDEASMVPTRYSYQSLPNVLLWDLPGANLAGFEMNLYLKEVRFERYDFYIIVSQSRFRECDGVFSKKIQEQEKGFYYIRSKIDNDAFSMQMQGIEFSEGERQIRKDILNNFQSVGVVPSAIFLISSLEVNKYDFPKLKSALATDLQSIKLNAFSLAVPNMVREIQEPKRRRLMWGVWLLSFLSALLGAARVPSFPLLTVIGCTLTGLIYLWRQVRFSDRERHSWQHHSPLKWLRVLPKALLGVLTLGCTVASFTHSITPVALSVCGAVTSFMFTFLVLKDELDAQLRSVQNRAGSALPPAWGTILSPYLSQ
ncbi:interferon-gamma-inducible GTPase 10-like [Narcine bancroftii]|uniref:interferon-gamma-inducible GTPase 10-like n=1 Tax=Narcine bancroftii TaxID=1343680 RepID=UPI003831E442